MALGRGGATRRGRGGNCRFHLRRICVLLRCRLPIGGTPKSRNTETRTRRRRPAGPGARGQLVLIWPSVALFWLFAGRSFSVTPLSTTLYGFRGGFVSQITFSRVVPILRTPARGRGPDTFLYPNNVTGDRCLRRTSVWRKAHGFGAKPIARTPHADGALRGRFAQFTRGVK